MASTPSRRRSVSDAPDEASFWWAVRDALESNARTARFVVIVLTLAVAVAIVEHANA